MISQLQTKPCRAISPTHVREGNATLWQAYIWHERLQRNCEAVCKPLGMQYIVTTELDAFGRRVYVAPQLKMQAVDGMSRTLRQAIHEPLFFALCSAPNVHPHMGLLLFLNKEESTQVKSPESRAETKRQVYDIMLAMPRAPFSLNQLLSVGAAAGEGYWLVVVPQPTQDTAAAAGVGLLYSMLLPDHKQTAKAWQAEVCSKWAAAPQCGCTLMEYYRLQALRAQGVELTGRTVVGGRVGLMH